MQKNTNYLFGKKAIIDAINNNVEITCIYCLNKNKEISNLKNDVNFSIVNKNFFNEFKNVNHQFLVASVKQKINHISIDTFLEKYAHKNKVTILMVDENQDARNFGSIIRTSVGLGVDAIIYKNKNQVPINDLVIKSSIGAAYYIDFIKVANLNQTIDKLKENGFWIYATGLSDKAILINEISFDNKSAIIVGNEDYGINNLTLKKSDFIIKIPMSPKIQSLNISVATGIILNKRFN